MMKSAEENADRLRPPLTIHISAAEPDIGEKLRLFSAFNPTISGGLDDMRVDQAAITDDGPLPNTLGSGSETLFILEPGFCVSVMDGTVAHDWRLTARASEDALRFRFSFDGQAEYSAPGSHIHDDPSRCTFLIQHAGAGLTAVYRRNASYRYCTIDVSRRFLRDSLGLGDEDLPRALLLHWRHSETAFGHLSLSRAHRSLAGQLFRLESQGRWQLVQVKALALDLLRQTFEAWHQGSVHAPTLMRIRAVDRQALTELRDLAEGQCPRAIPLAEACAMTGLNRTKLQSAFRQMFGVSLQQYCADLRMQMARDLLQDPALTIAEVAEKVGFSEPTNFSAAFRKHFLLLPSAIRREAVGTA